MNKICFRFLFLLLIISSTKLSAQDRPIGYWRAHMPYTEVKGVVTDGVRFYVATKESFFTYNAATNEISKYSKVEGMADVEMSAIAYDATTDIVVLGYKNTNIDLFIDETFYNIPDIKIKTINGIKEIYQIYTEGGMAYISTSFGVVVLDLMKKETKETYTFTSNNQTIPIKSFASDASHFYAATPIGLYRASKNSPNLQAFSSWQMVDTNTGFINVFNANNSLFAATINSVYEWKNNSLSFFYESPYQITRLSAAQSGLFINEYIPSAFSGKIKKVDFTGNVLDSFATKGKPTGVVRLSSGDDLYVVDEFNGLTKYTNNTAQNEIKPQGPTNYGCFDMDVINNSLWLAHGGYDREFRYIFNQGGVSKFENEQWQNFTPSNNPVMANTTDYVRVIRDPDEDAVYFGSFSYGLFRYANGIVENLTSSSPQFENADGDPGSYRISGLAYDAEGNLWMTQSSAPHELLVKTKDGQYYNFLGAGSRLRAASVIVDDHNQKWYITPGTGVAIYNDNGTISDLTDDAAGRIDVSKNLPSNNTYSIAKDKDGAIWIGTSDGIGIVNCPSEAIQGDCNVEKRIVQYDNFAGFLFQGETVLTIAVDGANRKWIGTTNGVWLISPNADKIINRFTVDNSPLPSNSIQKIAIDPVTGDVYIGTDLGLVSYRSTATEGTEAVTNVVTYPNPVPSAFDGTIAIKGLPANSDVRITDITGQLIYRTRALGGQAVWSGKDYTGRRPQSGVYLIFASNNDGSQTYQGKMVFME